MNDKTTITVSRGFRDELKAEGKKGERYEKILKRKINGVDKDELKPIAAEFRRLVELGKKNRPEGLTWSEVNEKLVELINKMRLLIGEKPLHWSKDGDGSSILVSEEV